MSNQRSTGRLERRAEREAREAGGNTPRARRRRVQTRNVDNGPKWVPGPLRNMSGTTLGIAAIAIAAVAILIYGVTQIGGAESTPGWMKSQLNDDPNLPGVYYAPHPGPDGQIGTQDDRRHVATGTVIPLCTDEQKAANPVTADCYTTNPPNSGSHADRPMPFAILENPAPRENLLHNMEHGGVVIWYNTTNQDVIDKLKDIVEDRLDRRQFVVMSQYPGMEADTIALTAWTRLDKFTSSEFTKERVEDFISEHHKRFNPEGF